MSESAFASQPILNHPHHFAGYESTSGNGTAGKFLSEKNFYNYIDIISNHIKSQNNWLNGYCVE